MATTTDDDDLYCILSEQRRELMAAESLESDLDLAFQLQLQEAINASVASLPSSSSAPPPVPSPAVTVIPEHEVSVPSLQTQEIDRVEQEIDDRRQSELEILKIKEDVERRIHDQRVAREIVSIPDHDWHQWGDDFEKPYGVGTSKRVNNDGSDFRLYFKGLASEEILSGKKAILAGIGIAICDPLDNLVFEISKPLIGNGLSRHAAEAKALIEGLNAALALELQRITIFCDYKPLYQFVTGRWPAKQRKVAMLVNQVSILQRKFKYCNTTLVARNVIKFAFKFARDAIVSQTTKPAESNGRETVNETETCAICLEDTDVGRIFSVDGCMHRYCFSCMKQHVEVKLLHGIVPKCPHEKCNSELAVESSRKFLTPKLIGTLRQRIKEASIPAAEKVYCPYPHCSALMSKRDVSEYARTQISGSERSGAHVCMECRGRFCINCKVPWHKDMTCDVYKRLHPFPPAEDVKLKSLATRNLWRQCVKCSHMIELAEGCYHMTCRCGFEFCYNCGEEWKDKKATCSCPLWDENNIWDDREEDEDEEYDEFGSEYDSLFDSDGDNYW